MKNLNQILKDLPESRREKIDARTHELILEENALRQLRKARKFTQERVAELMGMGQDSVSRLERRTDFLLSTLRSYVEAMGGSLKLVVKFDDQEPVVISSISEEIAEPLGQAEIWGDPNQTLYTFGSHNAATELASRVATFAATCRSCFETSEDNVISEALGRYLRAREVGADASFSEDGRLKDTTSLLAIMPPVPPPHMLKR